ncbi:hypothetical protein VQL36_11590 [Chengkuizengella sp. SCS-71B]|uniref:hypothetical protein n=1 Tax=Chengkuizengella sp. SCS-71B TaxID=3115290 RepID=UPI0032C2304D
MNEMMTSIPVNIYNTFEFNGEIHEIDSNLEQYRVKDLPAKQANGSWNDWVNLATMDCVIVIQDQDQINFYDQKGEDITKFVHIVLGDK